MNTTDAILNQANMNDIGGRATWIADPGHEWLLVPAAKANPDLISPFSYALSHPVFGNWYALEGDCDAAQIFTRLPDYAAGARIINVDGDACVRNWPSCPRGKASTPIYHPA